MKVHLAGFNVDTQVFKEIEEKCGKREDLTPEVISAAYARISRDPRPINEIRKDSRQEVEKTRRSNSTIIFKMGHHSVAEHAVFNLDVIGVSRYAMEELEKFRLCSYTEKSQRYITLDKDFVIPEEIKGTRFEKTFNGMVEEQNKAYFAFLEKLNDHVFKKHSVLAKDDKNRSLLEGWAKEDARYITALATESQVGLTVNARNLELMLRRFASHPLSEIQKLGRAIYEQISEVAPSVVIFHQANDRDKKTYPELKNIFEKLCPGVSDECPDKDDGCGIKLVDHTPDADNKVATALFHTVSGLSYEKCRLIIENLSDEEKADIFKTAWQNMQFYDSMLREFEHANLTYDIVLSSACFGQLKRHRMSTITAQSYDTGLCVTVPESIKDIGMEKRFLEIIDKTNGVYDEIKKEYPKIAPYILTNAHRKRVLIRLNARELYHISRLREDAHAQWDIQNLSRNMTLQAKEVMPYIFGLIGGKDKYNNIYQSLFGESPKVVEAVLPGARKIKIDHRP